MTSHWYFVRLLHCVLRTHFAPRIAYLTAYPVHLQRCLPEPRRNGGRGLATAPFSTPVRST